MYGICDCCPFLSLFLGRFGKSLVRNYGQKTTKLYSGVQNTGSPYDPARSDACMGGSWSSCNDSKPF